MGQRPFKRKLSISVSEIPNGGPFILVLEPCFPVFLSLFRPPFAFALFPAFKISWYPLVASSLGDMTLWMEPWNNRYRDLYFGSSFWAIFLFLCFSRSNRAVWAVGQKWNSTWTLLACSTFWFQIQSLVQGGFLANLAGVHINQGDNAPGSTKVAQRCDSNSKKVNRHRYRYSFSTTSSKDSDFKLVLMAIFLYTWYFSWNGTSQHSTDTSPIFINMCISLRLDNGET